MAPIGSLCLVTLTLLTSLISTWAFSLPALIDAHDELSLFGSIASRYPGLLSNLTGTILAPSNEAITAFVSRQAGGDIGSLTEELVNAFFQYHYLPLSLRGADLGIAGGAIVETSLIEGALANLEGTANVVFASAYGSSGLEAEPSHLRIFSGVGEPANVTTQDLEIDGGAILHIIDRVLNFPQTCTETARAASLSTLLSALEVTNLTEFVDTTPKFTCFAPTDQAFRDIGIELSELTTEQITDALKYHSIVGDVGYSTAFEDGKEYQTLLGVPVTVHKRDGQLFINDVAVAAANNIMTNGVAHVLSGVLTPPSTNVTTPSGSGVDPSPGDGNVGAAAGNGTKTSTAGSTQNTNSGAQLHAPVSVVVFSVALGYLLFVGF